MINKCPWWKPHKFAKWKDYVTATTTGNHPILIQERRCTICNKAERKTIYS